VEEIAPRATFEEVCALFLDGEAPTPQRSRDLDAELRGLRALPGATRSLLDAAARHGAEPMDALRMAAATLPLLSSPTPGPVAPGQRDRESALRSVALYPVLIAYYWRRRNGREPIAPDPGLAQVANFLWMLEGERPGVARARGLETYLNTVVDHGMNASTFTARVIVSTAAPLDAALVGALGALQGPLHGGAPGPALDMVFEIGEASRAEAVLRAKIARGERLMGFGHRVYRVRDPRAEVLAAAAAQLAAGGENRALYELARAVEGVALKVLAEAKPGHRLATNVEFYTALLLHLVGLPKELFTTLFASSRVVGWIAHCFEQQRVGRLIRPQSRYLGERRRWPVPASVGA
jgi:citrate synthase